MVFCSVWALSFSRLYVWELWGLFLHKGKACLLKMNYWWAPSAQTREQLFPHTQTSSPQTLNIQLFCVFIGTAIRKPYLQCLLKFPVLLPALLWQCSFQEAVGTLWGCLDGGWNLTRRGRWVQWDGEVLIPGCVCRWALLSSVLQGRSLCQEGFPQQPLLPNTLCFDRDTHVCALTGVSENTGLTSGAGSSEGFSPCYLRSGKSGFLQNA